MMGGRPRYVWRAVVENSLPPVLTISGVIYGLLLGGAVLVETVFGWGGVGQYAVTAILQNDYFAIQGFVLVAAIFSVVVYLTVDLLHAALDPRVRRGLSTVAEPLDPSRAIPPRRARARRVRGGRVLRGRAACSSRRSSSLLVLAALGHRSAARTRRHPRPPRAALERAPVRHRPVGRDVFARDLSAGRADISDRRRRRAPLVRVGRLPRPAARLLPRPVQRAVDARARRRPGLPAARLRARAARVPRPRHVDVHVRDRLRQHPDLHPAGAHGDASRPRAPFVEAASAVGNSTPRIVVRHVLPNVVTSSLIQLTSTAGFGDPARRRPQLPRRRHPAAAGRVGLDDPAGLAVLVDGPVVGVGLPRHRARS